MPWPTTNPPVQLSPSRPSASSFSSRTVTSQPEPCSSSATAEPTRPHPITIAFTAGAAYSGTAQVAANSSSSTDCGKATISTSHGAWRST